MAKVQLTTSRQLIANYFVMFAINAIVIIIANMLFPSAVVLGTGTISLGWAVALSMGKLALISIIAVPIIEWYSEINNLELENKHWMLYYLVVNFIGLWAIARFSGQLGLGLSSWIVALVLAAVLDFAQGLGVMLVYRNKS